jgi:periplasmic protein TonB
MLGTLLESRKRSSRRRFATVMSAIAHCILLIGLVMARAQGTSAGMSKPVATNVVYIAPKPQQPPPITRPAPMNSALPIPDFPSLPHVIVAPVRIDNVLDATRLPGEVATNFSTTGTAITRDTITPAGSIGDVMTAMTVDRQVELIPKQRPPRYPFALERAGITGDVVAQFVVDTTGRVERASVDIQQATHAEFARAVQERLAALRFVPARARGHAVRQLVQQRFHFEVVRR